MSGERETCFPRAVAVRRWSVVAARVLLVSLTTAVTACGGGGSAGHGDGAAGDAPSDKGDRGILLGATGGHPGAGGAAGDAGRADTASGSDAGDAAAESSGVADAGGSADAITTIDAGQMADGAAADASVSDGAGVSGDAGVVCPLVPTPGPPVGLSVDFVTGVAVSTLAGSGILGTGEGTGAGVGLDNPVSVAVSPSGGVYVAEYDGNRIRRLTAAGASSTIVYEPSLFSQPFGLVAVNDSTLYVDTDYDAQGMKSSQSGTIWSIDVAAGTAAVVKADIGRPRGVALLSDGRLVLADYRNNVLLLLDPQTGVMSPLAGNGCPGYADGQGVGAQFNIPYGLALLPNGTIIVADSGNNRLRAVTLAGAVTTLAGDGLSGMLDGAAAQARFYAPEDVATDAAGAIYVSDPGNHRIRRLAAGQVQTLAGDGNPGFNDGSGDVAEFFGQEGLAVTADGLTVYVADGNDGGAGPYHRVRAVAVPPP